MYIPIRCWLLICAGLALSTCNQQDRRNFTVKFPMATFGTDGPPPVANTTTGATTPVKTTTGATTPVKTTTGATTTVNTTTGATTTAITTTGATKGVSETSGKTAGQTSITRITGSETTAPFTTKAAGNVTIEPTTGHTSAHTSDVKSTTKAAPSSRKRKFDVASFFGGILLVLGLVAIVVFVYQCYQKRKGATYSRLEA